MVTCLLLAVILILLVYIVMSGREMFFSGDAIESTPGDKLVMFYADKICFLDLSTMTNRQKKTSKTKIGIHSIHYLLSLCFPLWFSM